MVERYSTRIFRVVVPRRKKRVSSLLSELQRCRCQYCSLNSLTETVSITATPTTTPLKMGAAVAAEMFRIRRKVWWKTVLVLLGVNGNAFPITPMLCLRLPRIIFTSA